MKDMSDWVPLGRLQRVMAVSGSHQLFAVELLHEVSGLTTAFPQIKVAYVHNYISGLYSMKPCIFRS